MLPGLVLGVPVVGDLDRHAVLGDRVADHAGLDPVGDHLRLVGDLDDDPLVRALRVRLAVDPLAARAHRPVVHARCRVGPARAGQERRRQADAEQGCGKRALSTGSFRTCVFEKYPRKFVGSTTDSLGIHRALLRCQRKLVSEASVSGGNGAIEKRPAGKLRRIGCARRKKAAPACGSRVWNVAWARSTQRPFRD